MSDSSVKAKLIGQSKLDFLHDLKLEGIALSPEDEYKLVQSKLVDPRPEGHEKPRKDYRFHYDKDLKTDTDYQNSLDDFVDIMQESDKTPKIFESDRSVIMEEGSYDEMNEDLFKYSGGADIKKSQWKPKDILDHSAQFVAFVNSINSGFQNMIFYKPFAMYCQQAEDWLKETKTIYDCKSETEKTEWLFSEYDKCADNTLYAMDKHLQIKEGSGENFSMMKYESKPVHKLLCFLIDCGYSLMAGKPRQIAATTTIGGIALFKSMFNRNFFVKMIAQDKEKVQEIFDDKIKFPYGELEKYMKLSVSNDSGTMFRFARKKKKGTKGGANSKIQVVAPSVSAINGGAPPIVLIDEAGLISILGRMIREARPTMFFQDPITKKLKMKRQMIVWGTGGEMDSGGRAFEVEFNDNMRLWDEGIYSSGMIPLFFDWTTRPGITKEFYLKEKAVYTVDGPEKEAKSIQFRQAFPSTIADMFLVSHKLLAGADWIQDQIKRIQDNKYKIKYGYMEPIYDTSDPQPEESDTPFRIIGAIFTPCNDNNMDMATVMILSEPKNWKNRYYKGTDPIMSDDGYSKMGSVIVDAVYNAPVAVMNYRDPDHKKTFLQCMLLGLYFGHKSQRTGKIIPPKELVESNIGTGYCDYVESKGFLNSLVVNSELDPIYQGGKNDIGIDNRGGRKELIILSLQNDLHKNGEYYHFPIIFEQIKYFVCKVNEKGVRIWGTSDVRKYNDDVLDGQSYAVICQRTFFFEKPMDMSDSAKNTSSTQKYTLVRKPNGELTRQLVSTKKQRTSA